MGTSLLCVLVRLLVFLHHSAFIATAVVGDTASLSEALRSPVDDPNIHCVSGTQWPDWDGVIDFRDCADAIRTMMTKIPPPSDREYAFWTGATQDHPPVLWTWKLPTYTNGGTVIHARHRFLRFVRKI